MISRWTRARAVIWVALAVFTAAAAPARAADFIVNTPTDGTATAGGCTPGPGGCTLREAILDATPVDRVLVPVGNYVLTQGPLQPVGDTIVGAGARTTVIDGGGTGNVFSVTTAGNQISGLTITNGGGASQSSSAGGGIIVSSSFAPASLTLTDSTVRGNRAQAGGGIANIQGTLTVVGSTVAGNTAQSAQSTPFGGGIVISGGTTTLRNTTVSGNVVNSSAPSAQGGGIYITPPPQSAGGTLVTQNVTIAGNQAPAGGGLYRVAGTSATISHTIISGNLVGGACAGSLAQLTADHNIADDASCGFGGTPANALLAALANNGGPTDTHALPANSPAVDAGTSCSPTDQRGAARVGACDIGAFEFVPPPPPPPPPQQSQQLPPPVAGKSVNALFKSGKVKVKLPRTRSFVALTEDRQIPVGTIVDTLKGRVTIVAAADKKGGTATSDFYGGIFKLGQTKGATPITTLDLVEKLSCKKSGKASAAAKKKKRKLWGDGKGRFRTEGSYSSATVRGTKWLVQDSCTSTLTRVVRGRVAVRDFAKRKTVLVKAGRRYVARQKKR